MSEDQTPSGARLAVVVASVGRASLLLELLGDIENQTDLPEEVVISVPTRDSLPALVMADYSFTVTLVIGTRGAAAQRNAGVDALTSNPDYVVFFDDDAIPRADYFAAVRSIFGQNRDVVGLTGHAVIDGAQLGRQVSREEALSAIDRSVDISTDETMEATLDLYGCNFAVRGSALLDLRFDSRLPLYSWLEDLDFARRLGRTGRLVRSGTCVIAHLGSASGGRTQHIRFGYSQITNPMYLWRKGSISFRHAMRLVFKPGVSNLFGSVWGNDTSWRRQRLRGNFVSISDLARRRLTPERIVDFS